jgi:hypothetical protein
MSNIYTPKSSQPAPTSYSSLRVSLHLTNSVKTTLSHRNGFRLETGKVVSLVLVAGWIWLGRKKSFPDKGIAVMVGLVVGRESLRS